MDFITPIITFFKSGGFFMYPIAVVLVLGLSIAIERWIFLSRAARQNRVLWAKAQPLLNQNDLQAIGNLANDSQTAIGRILSNGVAQARFDKTRSELEVATEEGLMEVLPALEERTHYLATFSNMSTLLGLLGTVIGLITAFAALGTADPTEKADLLSASISEAMNCTAFGLMVAIPTLLMHAVLQSKTTKLVDSLEAVAAKFVSAVAGRGRGAI